MLHQVEKPGAAHFLCGGLIYAAVYQTMKAPHIDGAEYLAIPGTYFSARALC